MDRDVVDVSQTKEDHGSEEGLPPRDEALHDGQEAFDVKPPPGLDTEAENHDVHGADGELMR